MKYTAKDIALFLFTYNRPDMCEQSLQSLMAQKGSPDICVLDNSDNDDTQELIKKYPGIKYYHTPKDIAFANYKTMQKIMDKPYALTLHDDDLLHPDFLQLALKVLNKYDDISFIGSKNTIFYGQKTPNAYIKPAKLETRHYLIESQAEFALCFWDKPAPQWSGSIIKTEFYKNTNQDALQKQYGKIADWPMMIETMKTGKAVIFTDGNCMFYRRHKGQDTCCDNTGISMQQLLNWLNMFKNFAKTNKKLWKIYFLRAPKNAISNYKIFTSRQIRKDYPIDKLMDYLVQSKALSPAMAFYNKYGKNIFSKLIILPMKLYYKRDYYKKMLRKI